MSSPTADQATEIEFVSGVTAGGLVSARSFDAWNGDAPATYGSTSGEAKWGAAVAGTGAMVTVAFDPASHWTGTEQAGFTAAMELWSAVADIHFTTTSGTSGAGLVFTRTSDKSAEELTSRYYQGYENTARLGTLLKTSISIDPSVYGFGPIGASLSVAGGYPWMTIEHEIGHALGLGHAGPYNDEGGNGGDNYATLGAYDSRAWTIMSYHDVSFGLGNQVPTTPMVLDVAAAQRLYGVATDGPLAGGNQVFGFHSTITGDLARFFDFTQNTAPVVTIWAGGANNTLDLSGFASASTVSLEGGSLNSVAGGGSNLGIAFGAHIDGLVGGAGADRLTGNALNDVIQGGAGADTIAGGSGNDHLYGNLAAGAAGGSDGDDVITSGGGSDYINGNAGNDRITVDGAGASRVQGGAGDDTIILNGGNNRVNGNLGSDTITAAHGTNTIMGGQGDDRIHLGDGNTVVSGDLGNDHIFLGSGYALMTGGAGNDIFEVGQQGQCRLDRGGELAGLVNEITDFQPGADLLFFPRAIAAVLRDGSGLSYGSVDDARAAAQALLSANPGTAEVAAMQVGQDTLLFWSDDAGSDRIDCGLRLDHLSATSFTTASITGDTSLMR